MCRRHKTHIVSLVGLKPRRIRLSKAEAQELGTLQGSLGDVAVVDLRIGVLVPRSKLLGSASMPRPVC